MDCNRRGGDVIAQRTEQEVTYCARHADVETYLRCQACETPICPRCLVHTPVGAKCPACARVRPPVQYQVSPAHLLRGAGGGMLAGGGVGVLWGLLFPPGFGLISIFGLFAGVLAGYGVAEAISRATNRRRGRYLVLLAIVCVLFAYVVRNLVAGGDILPQDDALGWAMLAVAALVAGASLR